MRTNWGRRANAGRHSLLLEYEAPIGAQGRQLEGYWGDENSDPARVAQIVLKIAQAEILTPHISLGSDAFRLARQAEQARGSDADRWKEVSVSIEIFRQAIDL